jgi:hypothetical protein
VVVVNVKRMVMIVMKQGILTGKEIRYVLMQ